MKRIFVGVALAAAVFAAAPLAAQQPVATAPATTPRHARLKALHADIKQDRANLKVAKAAHDPAKVHAIRHNLKRDVKRARVLKSSKLGKHRIA